MEKYLLDRLMEYGESDAYPFHMPGHKRQAGAGFAGDFPNPFSVDITEIEGFDNLHHPEGILKESMEWAGNVYGADRTYYLVNGSSCGILSAVCGSVSHGGTILMSRNCHKSAYHGVYLGHLRAEYIYPQTIPEFGIQGGLSPEDVRRLLITHPETEAVLVVSPTYDGIVSDIGAIAKIVHEWGIPLIVDEAHGAHFPFGGEAGFPVSALELGADVVIQSLHKTLPSLTQTAVMHVNAGFADISRIDRYVHMVQSSSPSYVFMASIENSIYQMEHMDMEPYRGEIMKLRERLRGMERLRLVDTDIIGQYGIHDLDVSKIVISTRDSSLTGADLDSILRREYHLEMEMCGADYVTAITTPMDRSEGLRRLGDALMEIDNRTGPAKSGISSVYSMRSDTAMTIADAMDGKHRKVRLEDCAGSISGEFVYIYPPGIPIVAPGEWISRRSLDVIMEYMKKGLPVQGPADQSLAYIEIVQKD